MTSERAEASGKEHNKGWPAGPAAIMLAGRADARPPHRSEHGNDNEGRLSMRAAIGKAKKR